MQSICPSDCTNSKFTRPRISHDWPSGMLRCGKHCHALCMYMVEVKCLLNDRLSMCIHHPDFPKAIWASQTRRPLAPGVMKPMMSKSWSCSSLNAGLKRVRSYYDTLRTESLSEKEMEDELKVPCLELLLNTSCVLSRLRPRDVAQHFSCMCGLPFRYQVTPTPMP